MKYLFLALIFIFTANVHADLVEIHLEESNKNKVFKFVVDTKKGLTKGKKLFTSGFEIEAISKYTINDEDLYFRSKRITNAEKILFQGTVADNDIVVIRNTNHPISSPKKLLRAVAGHPVPYKEILLIILLNGEKLEKNRLLKQESYGTWTATVWSQDSSN